MKTRRTSPHVRDCSLDSRSHDDVCAACPSRRTARANRRQAARRAANQARFEANVSADARASASCSPTASNTVHSNGELDSKQSFIESLTSGQRGIRRTVADIESVRILGDVAIIRGTAKVTVDRRRPVARPAHRLHRRLGLEGHRWQMTAWRSRAHARDTPAK